MSSGARQFQAIVHWQHRRGPAHCLLRAHLPVTGPALAVVSEVRSNEDILSSSTEFPAVADTVMATLPSDVEIDPAAVIWIAHYGEFSSYDAYAAPEGFARILLDWDGTRFHGDLEGYLILEQDEAEELLAGVTLAPVPEALRDLGWTY